MRIGRIEIVPLNYPSRTPLRFQRGVNWIVLDDGVYPDSHWLAVQTRRHLVYFFFYTKYLKSHNRQ